MKRARGLEDSALDQFNGRLPAAVSATAAVTTATTAAPPAAPAAAEAATPAAATAAAAPFGLVDAKRTTVEQCTVGLGNRLLSLGIGAHGDEREAARTAGLAIHHDVHVGDRADRREALADGLGRRVEGKIAHVESVTHSVLSIHIGGAVTRIQVAASSGAPPGLEEAAGMCPALRPRTLADFEDPAS